MPRQATAEATADALLAHGIDTLYALSRREPAVIHARVGEMPSPWDMLALPRVRGLHEAWRPSLP